MGVYQAYSGCAVCGRLFFYNPHRVPSVRVRGHREPICQACIERANPQRVAKGLPPIEIHPDAYGAVDESEFFPDDV